MSEVSTAATRAPRTRRLRRAGLLALAGLLAWVVAGLPFIAFPHVDPVPRHADVVLVLGPPSERRIAVAQRLLRDGRVGTALVSIPSSSYPPQFAALCSTAGVICFDPRPGTTRGEARELRTEAAERGWSSAVVVTMGSHLARSRTLVARCFGGRIAMVPSGDGPFHGWVYQYLYQTAATVKAWLLPGC